MAKLRSREILCFDDTYGLMSIISRGKLGPECPLSEFVSILLYLAVELLPKKYQLQICQHRTYVN